MNIVKTSKQQSKKRDAYKNECVSFVQWGLGQKLSIYWYTVYNFTYDLLVVVFDAKLHKHSNCSLKNLIKHVNNTENNNRRITCLASRDTDVGCVLHFVCIARGATSVINSDG